MHNSSEPPNKRQKCDHGEKKSSEKKPGQKPDQKPKPDPEHERLFHVVLGDSTTRCCAVCFEAKAFLKISTGVWCTFNNRNVTKSAYPTHSVSNKHFDAYKELKKNAAGRGINVNTPAEMFADLNRPDSCLTRSMESKRGSEGETCGACST